MSALVFSACNTLPPAPEGKLCSHWEKAHIAICNDIKSGSRLPDIPISETDKWILTDPDTWQNIMDYIDKLKVAASEAQKNAIDPALKHLNQVVKKTQERPQGRQ